MSHLAKTGLALLTEHTVMSLYFCRGQGVDCCKRQLSAVPTVAHNDSCLPCRLLHTPTAVCRADCCTHRQLSADCCTQRQLSAVPTVAHNDSCLPTVADCCTHTDSCLPIVAHNDSGLPTVAHTDSCLPIVAHTDSCLPIVAHNDSCLPTVADDVTAGQLNEFQ